MQDLGLPPEARAAHEGAFGQVSQAGGCGGDEGIPHIFPGQVAWQDCAFRQVCWHILQSHTGQAIEVDMSYAALDCPSCGETLSIT